MIDLRRVVCHVSRIRHSTVVCTSFWDSGHFDPRSLGRLGHTILVCLGNPTQPPLLTITSMYLPNPVYHQVAFAGILLTSVGRNFVLIQKFPSNHPGRNKVIKTAACGLATFATAFAFWNVDNLCCDQLRSMRKMLGVWGFLLEGQSENPSK